MKIEENFYEKIWNNKSEIIKIENKSRIDIATKLLERGNRLLDVGCGNGVLGYIAKNSYKEVYGIDISENALKIAKRRGVIAKKVNINYEKIPFEDKYFDAVVCLDVIEHVFEPRNLIKEISRIMKFNGILIISSPNIRNWKHLFDLVVLGKFPKTADDSDHWDGGHLHYFTYGDVENILKKNNIKVIEKRGVFGKNFLKDFRSSGIIIKAKKI